MFGIGACTGAIAKIETCFEAHPAGFFERWGASNRVINCFERLFWVRSKFGDFEPCECGQRCEQFIVRGARIRGDSAIFVTDEGQQFASKNARIDGCKCFHERGQGCFGSFSGECVDPRNPCCDFWMSRGAFQCEQVAPTGFVQVALQGDLVGIESQVRLFDRADCFSGQRCWSARHSHLERQTIFISGHAIPAGAFDGGSASACGW